MQLLNSHSTAVHWTSDLACYIFEDVALRRLSSCFLLQAWILIHITSHHNAHCSFLANHEPESITTLTIVTTMLQNVRCIPASDVSASEAAFQGVTVSSLAEHPAVTHSSL